MRLLCLLTTVTLNVTYRSPSLALTGNRKNPATDLSGKKCDQHAVIFTSGQIQNHPDIGLTSSGMILFAMLSGGDYDKVFGAHFLSRRSCILI